MAKLFAVVLGDDGLYHLFLGDGCVLMAGYSTPEDTFKAFHEKYTSSIEANARAERAINAGENVVRFPIPDGFGDE